MAGKRGRSGPPGNLNNARSILPALARLRRGRSLPAPLQRVTVIADREAQLIVSDKGGLDNMTGGERLMLNVWKTARQATLLILYETAQRGIVLTKNGEWDLSPGFARLVGFLNSERMALVALGLGRRSRDVTPSLDDLLREAAQDDGEGT